MAIAVIVLCVIHGFMTMFGASFCNVLPKLILEYVQVAAFLFISFMAVYESVFEIRNCIKLRKSGLKAEGDCNDKPADVKVLQIKVVSPTKLNESNEVNLSAAAEIQYEPTVFNLPLRERKNSQQQV